MTDVTQEVLRDFINELYALSIIRNETRERFIARLSTEPQAAPQRCVECDGVGWIPGRGPDGEPDGERCQACKGAPKPAEPEQPHDGHVWVDGVCQLCRRRYLECQYGVPCRPVPAEPQTKCSNCGHGLESAWQFCANCAEPTLWMPKPVVKESLTTHPAEPPKPRRMLANPYKPSLSLHSREHDELPQYCTEHGCQPVPDAPSQEQMMDSIQRLAAIPGGIEAFNSLSAEDAKMLLKEIDAPSAEQPRAWVCVAVALGKENGELQIKGDMGPWDVSVLPLPSRDELETAVGEVLNYDTSAKEVVNAIYRALGVSE